MYERLDSLVAEAEKQLTEFEMIVLRQKLVKNILYLVKTLPSDDPAHEKAVVAIVRSVDREGCSLERLCGHMICAYGRLFDNGRYHRVCNKFEEALNEILQQREATTDSAQKYLVKCDGEEKLMTEAEFNEKSSGK